MVSYLIHCKKGRGMQIQTSTKIEKHLKILEDEEIESIYEKPCFSHDECVEYFSLSAMEKSTLELLHSIKSKIHFIIQLGYFKSHHMFFVFNFQEVENDARYIRGRYFPDFQLDNLDITRVTRLKQQGLILKLFNYNSCDAEQRQTLLVKAQQVAMVSVKPIYIFRKLMHYMTEQRIVVPAYTFMQDTIGKALMHEQERLTTILSYYFSSSDFENLNRLFEKSLGLYEITQLKREPKDFSATEIKREIQRGQQIYDLYKLAKKLLPELKISNESIKYYASLVAYYSVFRLKQMNERTMHIYLLCFVYHRYQRLNDNLINSLIYNVRKYCEAAKKIAKDQVYKYHIEGNVNLDKAGSVLKLFTDDDIPQNTPFHEVQAKAFGILARQKINFIADHITKTAKFDETTFKWEHIDNLAHKFKRHLRPIILAVDFAAPLGYAPLIKAVKFLKKAFSKGRPLGQYPTAALPLCFISGAAKRYLYTPDVNGNENLNVNRYEFLVFRSIRNGLEAGDVFCRDSVRFRSFEDDLLDDKKWKNKDKLIATIGLPVLKQPIREHLSQLEKQLEDRIVEVNQRIISGNNKHFEIKKRGTNVRWALQYPCSSEPVNHPFFDRIKQVDIRNVMHFVNRHCQFMEVFDHILGRYAKQEADNRIITACLIAWGTNMGIGKMGETSDMDYQILSNTSDNFIRLETLRAGNDIVSNAISKLPIFRQYDIGKTLHSSSDGQKFETKVHTINARYSPKYFGLKKGIVSYTMMANHVPINTKIIGANEHESHYVFDILFNNSTSIQPEVHSTDTHGTNEVNFSILHLFGYQFAPRYRDIYDKVSKGLYGFKHPSQYNDNLLLKPIRKITRDLIIDEWENIQRIIVSLSMKTTTQSIVVGKLSAYARKNKTRRALWEYDNIIKNLYFLNYVDSQPLRRNVLRALNRVENYHQLRRAISYANFGKLRFKNEHEQNLWGECARLITNCILYYNTLILSNFLAYKEKIGDTQDADIIKKVSPVAWQHINLCGRYEFSKSMEVIDIDAIIHKLLKISVN